MAVAMQQRLLGHRRERELERAGLRLARQEFLEQQRVRGQATRILTLDERRDFVAEAEHAARLETDERSRALEEGGERGHAALRLAPRLVDEPDREEGAPAAQRSAVAVGGLRQLHGIAAGGEHRERGLDVLRLE